MAYRFEDSRSGERAARHLNGYRGIPAGWWIRRLYQVGATRSRNDRHHLGRLLVTAGPKFYELHAAGSSKVATTTVERMAKLWQVEKTVRGQSPDARVAARQQASGAVVAGLFDLWQHTLRRISGKSKLAEAIRYAVSRGSLFERFLTDGHIELDSNIVERAITPQTITRKNSLFAGSDGGGQPEGPSQHCCIGRE
ncbi:IS66 family transposase [Bradyrhizobium sp. CCBAU 45321]|uniref:IS66 family transposase n=1 Tax=Bradyrhizobium sp. CCBAU 45321 TaxID=1641878 RepID=UPI003FA4BD0A